MRQKPSLTKMMSFRYWFSFLVMFVVPVVSIFVYWVTDSLVEKRKEEWSLGVAGQMQNVVHSKVSALSFLFSSLSKELQILALDEALVGYVESFGDMQESSMGMLSSSQPALQSRIDGDLSSFAQNQGYFGLYLLDKMGRVLSESEASPALVGSQRQGVKQTMREAKAYFSPARMFKGVVVVDISIPVFKQDNKVAPIAVLTAIVPLYSQLKSMMEFNAGTRKNAMLELYQVDDGRLYHVDLQGVGSVVAWRKTDEESSLYGLEFIKDSQKNVEIFDKKKVSFGGEGYMPNEYEVIAVREDIPQSPFVLMYSNSVKEVLSFLGEYRNQMHLISQMITVVFVALFVALWWRSRQGVYEKKMEEYKKYAGEIESYKDLLEGMNNTVKEMVTLKSMNGKYTYVNPSFCDFLKKKEVDVLGLTDKAFFADEDVQLFEEMEKCALAEKRPLYLEHEISIHGRKFLLEMSKSPVRDRLGKFLGVATVVRDMTEVAKERKQQEEVRQNVVHAMMSIMERHDKHLVKHTKYLVRLVKLLSAKMRLKKADVATLEAVASLCQIGKVFVPPELLKKDNLNVEEQAIYEEHMNHTAFILDCVDWKSLPVVRTAYEMHELLDGSGYPNGIEDGDISDLARIMAVCNRFTELLFPTSHQVAPLTPEEAIKYLRDHSEQYDLLYIVKLTELIIADNEVLLAS